MKTQNFITNLSKVIYLSIVVGLGIGAVVVSTFDFFAGPKFRPLRAGEFFILHKVSSKI